MTLVLNNLADEIIVLLGPRFFLQLRLWGQMWNLLGNLGSIAGFDPVSALAKAVDALPPVPGSQPEPGPSRVFGPVSVEASVNAPKSDAALACTDSGLIAAPSPMLASSPVPASKSALVPAGGSSELVPG